MIITSNDSQFGCPVIWIYEKVMLSVVCPSHWGPYLMMSLVSPIPRCIAGEGLYSPQFTGPDPTSRQGQTSTVQPSPLKCIMEILGKLEHVQCLVSAISGWCTSYWKTFLLMKDLLLDFPQFCSHEIKLCTNVLYPCHIYIYIFSQSL